MLHRRSEAFHRATPLRSGSGSWEDGRSLGEALRLRAAASRVTGHGHGPGVRFTVELEGCPLRCPACADADARGIGGGRHVAVETIAQMAVTYADYMALTGGGLTVTMGEPLAQAAAVAELLRRSQAVGIPTALDSAGRGNPFSSRSLLRHTDLLLFDATLLDPRPTSDDETAAAVRMAVHAAAQGVPIRFRVTLLPGLNDEPERLASLAGFAAGLASLERVEIQPLSRHVAEGYEGDCDLMRSLRDAPAADMPALRAARGVFRRFGVRVE